MCDRRFETLGPVDRGLGPGGGRRKDAGQQLR